MKRLPARVALVVGTRPEATKLAPVYLALADQGAVEPTLITTGQHDGAVHDALEPFELTPDISLAIERRGPDLVDVNLAVQQSLARLFSTECYDAVVVQGDTASTLAGALVAYWNRIPLVHVEAGLRTGDLYAPFPEEGNRRIVSTLAALHIAPTAEAAAHLYREGVDPAAVCVTGNTAVDAVLHTASRAEMYDTCVPRGFESHVLITAHRRESWGRGIRQIARAVSRLSEANPTYAFLIATHMNPAVQRDMRAALSAARNVSVLAPLPYGRFTRTLATAAVVLTDSGGVLEEASALHIPVLILRDVTERPEVVDAGGAILVGTDADRIVEVTQRLFDDCEARAAIAAAPCPFGDGRAAERAADAIAALVRARVSASRRGHGT